MVLLDLPGSGGSGALSFGDFRRGRFRGRLRSSFGGRFPRQRRLLRRRRITSSHVEDDQLRDEETSVVSGELETDK